jgi:hypothetical protein
MFGERDVTESGSEGEGSDIERSKREGRGDFGSEGCVFDGEMSVERGGECG